MGATDQLFVTHQKVLASGVPSTHGMKQLRPLLICDRTRAFRRLTDEPLSQEDLTALFHLERVMSALGHKQTFASHQPMSAKCQSRTHAAQQKDRYSITSLVISRTSRLIVRSSSFAVFRFMTNSKLVGCCTGRPDGFAPFKILSTKGAADRNNSVKFAP